MSGIAKGIGNVVGSVVGGITGSNKAADAQVSAAKDSNQMAWNIYQDQKQTNQPFLSAGLSGLTGLTGIAGQPINRSQLLTDYYSSPEYQLMSDQARYQALNAAEATGGLGSTSTANNLAAIAPQLGQNYLSMMTDQQNNMYGQLLGLTNVGLSAAGANNAAAGNYSNAYGQNMGQIGAARAGQAVAGFNTLANGAAAYFTGGKSLIGGGGGLY
ncbi:DNA transfer protein [Pseudescherichia sp.]|uniref:DNA transfer protein n=1 Tax=Pseudescherichia sp. TaxID=2055881 RepID=UPI002899481F|nr:DNA transfer protein [Pseudescherichia sp.]